jgi:hypothetical protein
MSSFIDFSLKRSAWNWMDMESPMRCDGQRRRPVILSLGRSLASVQVLARRSFAHAAKFFRPRAQNAFNAMTRTEMAASEMRFPAIRGE